MKQLFTIAVMLFFSLSIFSQTNYSRVKIDLQQTDLQQIARLGIDVHEGTHKKGYFFETDLSSSEIAKLNQNGISNEILIENVSTFYAERAKAEKHLKIERNTNEEWVVPQNWEYGSMAGYYTLDEAYAEIDDMAALYPEIISPRMAISEDTLTHEGRKLWWCKISDNPNEDEDEPEVLYTSVHHAREVISIQQQIFFMWYLLENYETNPEIKWIVDHTELYFVPFINPDGYQENVTENPEGGGMWRKNKRNNGDGTYGVDPNRNYGYFWGLNNDGSSPWTSDETYRGPGPFSEPEIKNMRDFCNQHDFLITLNYHSYGRYFLAPWGYTAETPPDHDLLNFYGELLTMENGYQYGPGNIVIYPTNGGSDDWMYGEEETKDKTFSWTPEIGSSNDGFWPEVSRIIPLCQDQMWQNLTAAKLVGEYATLKSLSAPVTNQVENYASFSLQRLGMATTETFTVSIAALDNYIVDTDAPLTFHNMELLETAIDSIGYLLDESIEEGAVFRYLLTVDNGSFSVSDTITRIFGSEIVIFNDDAETLDNWTSSQWDITSEEYFTPEYSITDSPGGDYDEDVNSTLVLDTTINLTGATMAFLRFWARWDIEEGWDYVQLMVKDADGGTWKALEGNYTSFGNTYLDPNDPVYDGVQNEWVMEEINLSDYIGSEINLRFTFFSDTYVSGDGFYFDNLSVSVISSITGSEEYLQKESTMFVSAAYPNPVQDAFSIQYTIAQNDGAFLELYDAIGNRVQQLAVGDTKGVLKLQMGNLQPGIYFYHLRNGASKSQTKKVVKL